jgi:hypothetical protein
VVGAPIIGLGFGREVSGDQLPVAPDFCGGLFVAPAESRRHQHRRVRRRLISAVGPLYRDPGAAREHIVEVERALMSARVQDLGAQVAASTRQWLAEGGPRGDEVEQLGDGRSVPAEQALDLINGQSCGLRDLTAGRPETLISLGSRQGYVIGARRRYRVAGPRAHHQVMRGRVDEVACHHPVGGELAARDHAQPWH